MTWFKRLVLTFLIWSMSSMVIAEFDHGPWDRLLRDQVVVLEGGKATQVDYAAMLEQRNQLAAYLQAIAGVSRDTFESWPIDEQLAFLINTYNAWTVELILTEYPRIDSVRDIGFLPGAPWRRKIVSLFGEQVSLDDLEHEMIRGWGRYNEPRIHFAVNCAAIGCPALRAEAYTGALLNQQLESNTRLFLSDRSRNYFSNNTLYVSSIFDWYEEDFEKGWQGYENLSGFLSDHSEELGLEEAAAESLAKGELRIRYLRYNWDLNSTGN